VLSTTDDLRIDEIKELSTPQDVMREIPRTLTATRVVTAARNAIYSILNGTDDRLLVVVGPCSVHDPVAAVEYATRLAALRDRLSDRLEIVMRVYFEKPRTTVGWKGLINDPDLDGSFDINKGLRLARNVLAAVNNLGPGPSSSTSRRRNTSPTLWPGRRSARAPRKAKSIASSLRDCPARSASRTAPTAMCASPPTR